MGLINLAINAGVAVLLGVTILYCYRLDRRLTALRSGQDGLKEVITALDRATLRAQTSLMELKTMGLSAESTLKAEIGKADTLLDELKLMVQSADRVADKLAQARPAAGAAPSTATRIATATKDVPSGPMFDALRQAR